MFHHRCYINKSLLDYLDVFYTVFLDGILIYNNHEEDRAVHVLVTLQRLRDRGHLS